MCDESITVRAAALLQGGDAVAAARLAWECLVGQPDQGRLWEIFGRACLLLGDQHGARDALERATVLVPLSTEGQLTLAQVYARSGSIDPAHAILRHLGRTAAVTADLARTATLLGEMGCHRTALKVCRRIVRLHPHHHPAHFGIAFYLDRLGYGPRRLIPHLAAAMDLAPHRLTYRMELAFAWAKLEEWEQARGLLAAIAPVAVGCPCRLRRMAAIHDRAGDAAAAEACRRRLAELQSPNELP